MPPYLSLPAGKPWITPKLLSHVLANQGLLGDGVSAGEDEFLHPMVLDRVNIKVPPALNYVVAGNFSPTSQSSERRSPKCLRSSSFLSLLTEPLNTVLQL